MNRLLTRTLQVIDAIIFLVILLVQVLLLPTAAFQTARYAPEFAFLKWPMLLQAELFLICIQIALLALWMLLIRVRKDQIFDRTALRWVDVIIICAATATVLIWMTLIPIVFITHGPPGLSLMTLAGGTAGIAFTLLVTVMRSLLVQASTLREEMDVVI